MNTILTTLLVSLLQIYPVVLDDSPTRVQTTLDPQMEIMGTLKPKSVSEISSSRWTLDCGGMDREHADWRAVRGYVAPLGIARVRQQAGWARCEKDPGMYDFAWLDQCVFDAQKMGVKLWKSSLSWRRRTSSQCRFPNFGRSSSGMGQLGESHGRAL